MTFPEKETSLGQEAEQETSPLGPKTNQTMLVMKIVPLHLVLDTNTSGMTWSVVIVISILVKYNSSDTVHKMLF